MPDLNLSMFKAYDIRTPSAALTPELATRLARAEAVYFTQHVGVTDIVLARDARSTGGEYLEIATEQYLAAGLNVMVVPGVSSTSMFYFAAMKYPDAAAICFGASHNPSGDTGQKILGPGVRPIARGIGVDGGLDKIQALYEAGAVAEVAEVRGRIGVYDPMAEYIEYSMELAGVTEGSLSGLKLLHDYLHGAAGREMMLAFQRAGAALTPLHFEADGRFPLGDPNPVKEDVIAAGIQALNDGDFVFGTFFDGDGDRVDFYRGDGAYLSSSFVYAAILPAIYARMGGADVGVYADLKCNPLALMEMTQCGVSNNIIRNGHSQIKDALYETPNMLGAVEESAHFYEAFSYNGDRFCTENTLYVALLVARMWKENPARFDELLAIQASTARAREWGHKFPTDEARAGALSAVEAHFVAQGTAVMSEMPNGWDLEATILRRGIPFAIGSGVTLTGDWIQVCQRISQSENGLARWEIVAATPEIARRAKQDVLGIVAGFGASEEYQG
mgnify:CR=1 FL=1